MKVIKKNGMIQDFEKEKLYTSLFNASSETANGLINKSDANIIIEDVYRRLFQLRDKQSTSSYEIYGVVVQVLLENHFYELLKSYIGL